MEKELKTRMNFTLTSVNADWLKQMTQKAGLPMSLFIDALLTGVRVSMKDDVKEQEAIAMALEQLAKGLRK